MTDRRHKLIYEEIIPEIESDFEVPPESLGIPPHPPKLETRLKVIQGKIEQLRASLAQLWEELGSVIRDIPDGPDCLSYQEETM